MLTSGTTAFRLDVMRAIDYKDTVWTAAVRRTRAAAPAFAFTFGDMDMYNLVRALWPHRVSPAPMQWNLNRCANYARGYGSDVLDYM
jgi:hypothetical protein